MSEGHEEYVLVCPNVWYAFGKILNIKYEGIRSQIPKYRFRYNLIVFIYLKGPVEYNKKISRSFTVILNFYSRWNPISGRNSQNVVETLSTKLTN